MTAGYMLMCISVVLTSHCVIEEPFCVMEYCVGYAFLGLLSRLILVADYMSRYRVHRYIAVF